MARKIYSIQDFSGGLNVDTSPEQLKDNQLRVAQNVILDETGAVSKRLGSAPLNSVSYGAQVNELIEWRRNDDSTVLLAVIGSDLCTINQTDGTKTVIKSLSESSIGWFVYNDKFYFTGKESGTDKYWQYDGTTVSEVVANTGAGNDLSPIKRCRRFLWHPTSARIFATIDSGNRTKVYYSEANDPTYFKSTSVVTPTTGDGSIKAMDILGDAIVIMCGNSSWYTTGSDPLTDFVWKKFSGANGTTGEFSAVQTPDSLTFLDVGGLWQMRRASLNPDFASLTGNEVIVNLARDKVVSLIQSALNKDKAYGCFDRVNNRYMLAYCDTGTVNNKIIVMDWALDAFVIWTNIQANCLLSRADGSVLMGSSNYILKLNQTAYRDWDVTAGAYVAIESIIETKPYGFKLDFNQKKLRRMFMAYKQEANMASELNLKITYDYKIYELTAVNLDSSFEWGEAWGLPWGYADYSQKEVRIRGSGSRVSVEYSNRKIDEVFTLYGHAFEFTPKKPKGVRVN